MSAESFVKDHASDAKNAEAAFGVPMLVALAQSALETGWGARVAGNNYFGIRADKSWRGEVVLITTHEVIGGVRQAQSAQRFRAYPSAAESYLDWGRFLATNPRYHDAFAVKGDPKAFARAIAKAGYATDPSYADKLCQVIDSVQKRLA